MSGLALTLVLLSALAHAAWNFLLKRGANQEVFIWWSQATIAVALLPVALLLAWQYPVKPLGWWFLLGTSLLHILYFFFLGRGYAHSDLSLIYPMARGIGAALVPILGVLVLEESITAGAVVGIVAVVFGIYTVFLWGRASQLLRNPMNLLKEPGSRYGLLTGLVIAGYSLWDKQGVAYVNPFLYMYLMSLGVALGLAPYVWRTHGAALLRAEWRANTTSIMVAGLLMFLAYGLVLSALRISSVSYIAPAREVGIVFGVILGVAVLKEPYGRGRLIGSSLIVLGLVLIAAFP